MRSFSFGATEVKLLILVGYYFIVFLIFMVIFGVTNNNNNLDLLGYFHCEVSGHDPNNPCDDSVLRSPTSIAVSVIPVVLNVMTSFVLLIFVVNVKELKEKFQKCASRK